MLTGKFRTGLDAFYTRPDIAAQCVSKLKPWLNDVKVWIEPSAGEGAFVVAMKEEGVDCLAFDIEPENPQITKQDFLKLDVPIGCGLVGNPPFGSQSSLAKRFLQHGMANADIVAFILPRSFTKPSMQSSIPNLFHCVLEWELPKDSFLIEGRAHNVPCMFQVWKKHDTPRPPPVVYEAMGFKYVSIKEQHSLVIRRVGVNAGHASLPGTFSPQSHYFIQTDADASKLIEKLNLHIFPSNTTGPRSLSKSEINEVLTPLVANALGAGNLKNELDSA